MTLQELLGQAYREGMTVEEITLALADRNLLDASEVEKQVNNRTAAQKRLLDAANKKLAEAQKKSTYAGSENAELLARVATLEETIKASDRAAAIAKDTASYVALGYSQELAQSTAEALADGDTAKVNANMAAFIAQKTQSIREELMKGTPAPAAGGSAAGGVDYAKLKADALNAGNDVEYMRLCREEMEQATKK